MYYRNANCAVVVYDITQSASLEKARNWIRELQRQADPSIVIALCGNKSDLAARRQVTQEEAQKYAEEEGLMWAETSAKSGEGVTDIFTAIGEFHQHLHHVLTAAHLWVLLQPRSYPRLHQHRRELDPEAGQDQLEGQALTSTSNRVVSRTPKPVTVRRRLRTRPHALMSISVLLSFILDRPEFIFNICPFLLPCQRLLYFMPV